MNDIIYITGIVEKEKIVVDWTTDVHQGLPMSQEKNIFIKDL